MPVSRVASELSVIASHHHHGLSARRPVEAEAKASPFATLLADAGAPPPPAAPDRPDRPQAGTAAAGDPPADPLPNAATADAGDAVSAAAPADAAEVVAGAAAAEPAATADA